MRRLIELVICVPTPRTTFYASILVISMLLVLWSSHINAQTTSTLIVKAMDWNSDGSLLAYSSSGEACYTSESSSTYEIQVLHVETHAIVKTITGSKCPITSLDWSPDDSQILAASISGRGIDIWDVATSQSVNIKVV